MAETPAHDTMLDATLPISSASGATGQCPWRRRQLWRLRFPCVAKLCQARVRSCATPRRPCGCRLDAALVRQSATMSRKMHWRATVDEDGHYSFAIPLCCRSPPRVPAAQSATACDLALRIEAAADQSRNRW